MDLEKILYHLDPNNDMDGLNFLAIEENMTQQEQEEANEDYQNFIRRIPKHLFRGFSVGLSIGAIASALLKEYSLANAFQYAFLIAMADGAQYVFRSFYNVYTRNRE